MQNLYDFRSRAPTHHRQGRGIFWHFCFVVSERRSHPLTGCLVPNLIHRSDDFRDKTGGIRLLYPSKKWRKKEKALTTGTADETGCVIQVAHRLTRIAGASDFFSALKTLTCNDKTQSVYNVFSKITPFRKPAIVRVPNDLLKCSDPTQWPDVTVELGGSGAIEKLLGLFCEGAGVVLKSNVCDTPKLF